MPPRMVPRRVPASPREELVRDPAPAERAAILAAYDPWAHEPPPLSPQAPALRYREDAEKM